MMGSILAAATTAPASTQPATMPVLNVPSVDIGFWLLVLAGMALLPFILTMVTSFAKLVIVGGIIRQALGTQNIPPNTVITGLALIMTIHIMAPVARECYGGYLQIQHENSQRGEQASSRNVSDYLSDFSRAVLPRMEKFLRDHADDRNEQLFRQLSEKLASGQSSGATTQPSFSPDIERLIKDLTELTPAFILTELTQAFQIGFLIFVPFLVIDLVVSSILLAMGMHMLSPTTISLPLKLLLFVAIDGWSLILQGLALGYARPIP